MATLLQEGRLIDYTPSSAVAAGDVVVQGEMIGIAVRPIAANELGALAVEGVFDFPKETGVGAAILAGARVYWDVAAGEAKNDAEAGANAIVGKAVLAAGDNATTVRVKLTRRLPALLLGATFDEAVTGNLVLTFDQNMSASAPGAASLVVHTAANDHDEWTLVSVVGGVVTLDSSATKAASGTEDTLDWDGGAEIAGVNGGVWAAVSGFAVDVTPAP